jgi:hypothetical protein
MTAYRLNMSDTISISASAAAIFSADVGCGRPPPKRKDILEWVEFGGSLIELMGCCVVLVGVKTLLACSSDGGVRMALFGWTRVKAPRVTFFRLTHTVQITTTFYPGERAGQPGHVSVAFLVSHTTHMDVT